MLRSRLSLLIFLLQKSLTLESVFEYTIIMSYFEKIVPEGF